MGRFVILVWLVYVALGPAASAGAERHCADAGCVTLAWPDLALDLGGAAALQVLLGAPGLSAGEQEAVAALAQRRLTHRIRGLELRYLVGKTATSTSDPGALAQIRYQIDAIDLEIAFIDQQVADLLDAYSRRTGPWMMRAEHGGGVDLWFVAAPPCGKTFDLAVAVGDAGDWLDVAGERDRDAPLAEIEDGCGAWRLTAAGLSAWHRSQPLHIKSGGEVWHFIFDE